MTWSVVTAFRCPLPKSLSVLKDRIPEQFCRHCVKHVELHVVPSHSFPLPEFLSVLERLDSRTVLLALCQARGSSRWSVLTAFRCQSFYQSSKGRIPEQFCRNCVKYVELHVVPIYSHIFPLPESLSVLERSDSRIILSV